uniref:Uncharacterized protein n=1 Tax=Caenorhabditis japonica TaxID=281687 RepID=A0A8R1IKJ8_CAEJA
MSQPDFLIPFAVPCALFEPLHVFLIPTVILIVIQIVAILNSIAVSAGVKLMFEPKVRQALKKNLQESQTILQIRYLTRKVPKEVYEGADGMEMGVIRPQDEYHRVLCGAPVDSVVRDLHGN